LVGLDRIGLPKTMGVEEKIILHNPFIEVKNYPELDVLKNSINKYIDNETIGISSIADDNIEGYINQQAIINNKTIFYSRVLRGGKCARIIRVIPNIDACLNCLRLYKEEKNKIFIEIPEDENLPTITTECNNPIRPASAADIKLAASITSRIIIEYLQNEKDQANQWILITENIKIGDIDNDLPMAVYKIFIKPHPKCNLCKKRNKFTIDISKDAYDTMINEIRNSNKIETGGILIGNQIDEDKTFVEIATEPGPKAIRKTNYFERDVEFCQEKLNTEFKKKGNKSVYIGEWHYHPFGNNKPSSIDLNSLFEISISPNYLVNNPIMIIFNMQEELSCSVHPIDGSYYFTEYKIVKGQLNES
jgi:integrative and conjugative element protein (TIGR02256 family)